MVNPMSEERSVMRTALLPGPGREPAPGASASSSKSFAQFELARVFHAARGQRAARRAATSSACCSGASAATGIQESEQLRLLRRQGRGRGHRAAARAVVRPRRGSTRTLGERCRSLHPKRRARIDARGERAIGVLGELHPDVVAGARARGPAGLGDDRRCRTGGGDRVARRAGKMSALCRAFRPATRDLAVVVADVRRTPARSADALREAAGPLAEAVALFDIYRGEPVPAGRKSLAFHLVYRDPEATLTDKVVDELHAKVVARGRAAFRRLVRR